MTSGGGGEHPPRSRAPAPAPVPAAVFAQHGQDPVLHTEGSLWPLLLPASEALQAGVRAGTAGAEAGLG